MFEMVDPLPGALKLRMSKFVIGWSIVDLVMTGLRTLELPFIIAAFFLLDRFTTPENGALIAHIRQALWVELLLVCVLSFTGLMGNIGLLCRRHRALYYCFFSNALTMAGYVILLWQALLIGQTTSLLTFCILLAAAVLVILCRCALMVFNFILYFKAKAFFKERDGY